MDALDSSKFSKSDIRTLLTITAVNFQSASVLRLLLDSKDDENDGVEEDPDDDLDLAALLQTSGTIMAAAHTIFADIPRGPYTQIAKCMEYLLVALSWPDKQFRHEFRISRLTFERFVTLLAENPIFASTGRKPQRPVFFQLACFLMRFGQLGTDIQSVEHRMGIGYGTVFLYCSRVMRALRELQPRVIQWGDNARHAESKAHFGENGFDDCIGVVDGSLIRLTEMPPQQGVVYLCRKKYPAINVQAVVDHEKRFMSFESGWPGSVPDVTIWKKSHLWKYRHQFFNEREYLLADKGYPSSPFLLRPFTEPEVNAYGAGPEKQRLRAFNRIISNKRIYVEHAFGLLKNRFPSLSLLGTPKDIQDAYRAVEALMVIHNLCIDYGDHPTDFCDLEEPGEEDDDGGIDADIVEYGGVVGDGPVNIPAGENDTTLRERGYAMRQALLDQLCPI